MRIRNLHNSNFKTFKSILLVAMVTLGLTFCFTEKQLSHQVKQAS